MTHRECGSDAGNQKHIANDGIVYNEPPRRSLLEKPEEQYKVHLENLKSDTVSNLTDALPNVAIYSDGRQRSWEYKNGRLNKIVHADGQVWTRKDKRHWNISYNGKLIGKNVEMANVKVDKDKTLTWTVGGVKKSLSGTGEYHDPNLASKKQHEQAKEHVNEKSKDDTNAQTNTEKLENAEKRPEQVGQSAPDDKPFRVEVQHVTGHHLTDMEHTGVASWYGPGFHGRPTSSGEIYDMNKMTAAHRTLPFGTKLLVTDKHTGKSAIVTVTDRGPYKGNRVLDLSKAAARKLDMIQKGIKTIVYKVL